MIILDTNVLPNGPAAGSVVFPVLQVVASNAGQRLAVPRIVVDESCERLRRELLDAYEQIVRGTETVSKYLGASSSHPRPVDDLVVPNWREYLARLFVVLEPPDGAFEEALLREVQRKPPTRDGRGARDALIWLTVLDHLQRDETPTYFVSNNGKDFGKDGLLPELRAEIPDGSTLNYCTSIVDLLDRLATPSPQPLRRADIEEAGPVHEAIRSGLTGPGYFFQLFALISLETQGKTLTGGSMEVLRVSVEDSVSYDVGGERFAGVRCRVVTRHLMSTFTPDETDPQRRTTETVQIQTEPLLLIQQDAHGAVESAQVLQQTQPLRVVHD